MKRTFLLVMAAWLVVGCAGGSATYPRDHGIAAGYYSGYYYGAPLGIGVHMEIGSTLEDRWTPWRHEHRYSSPYKKWHGFHRNRYSRFPHRHGYYRKPHLIPRPFERPGRHSYHSDLQRRYSFDSLRPRRQGEHPRLRHPSETGPLHRERRSGYPGLYLNRNLR